MVNLLDVEHARLPALSVLINLTYCSQNTSIYLADSLQITEKVFSLLHQAPQDVAWLLHHLLVDGSVSNLEKIVRSRVFKQIEILLNRQNLRELVVLARQIFTRLDLTKFSSEELQQLKADSNSLVSAAWVQVSDENFDVVTLMIREVATLRLL